jgi:hypothetical protein
MRLEPDKSRKTFACLRPLTPCSLSLAELQYKRNQSGWEFLKHFLRINVFQTQNRFNVSGRFNPLWELSSAMALADIRKAERRFKICFSGA